MPFIPQKFITQEDIDAEVREAIAMLGPEVVRVNYNLTEDHEGDPAIEFRVLVRDPAAEWQTIGATTKAVEKVLRDHLKSYSKWNLYPYFRYRTDSEQAHLHDLEWS